MTPARARNLLCYGLSLEVTMSVHKLAILFLFVASSCGRPEFGATTEGGAVVDTDVDRAAANSDSGEVVDGFEDNNNETPSNEPDAQPPLDAGGGAFTSDFAFEAFRAASVSGRNAVLAPHGLARSLVIAHAAAAPELAATVAAVVEPYLGGDIYARFNSTDLDLEGRQSGDSFRMLAGVWVDEGTAVETSFAEVLAMYLGLQLRLIDFASSPEDARNQINNWYSSETAGQISEVLGPRTVETGTRFVITDATWFAASWGFGGFDVDRTTYGTFQGAESNVQLQMMQADATLLYFDGAADLEAVVMPFDNGFSLVAVLPADLDAFEAALEPGLLDRIVAEAQPTEVMLEFPRIEVSDRVSLSSVAQSIGVSGIFAPDAEFAGFADGTQLDDAHQRTRISFYEDGVDAQTSNDGMTPNNGSAGAPPPAAAVTVSFSRPFFFGVRDSATGQYLFLGRVAQP